MSERDLDVILASGVHVNLDLISQIHRYGRRAPGTAVGLRVNPRVSAVDPANVTHAYSGDRPTKFGIYPERLEEAVAVARSYALTIDTVHVHLAHQLRRRCCRASRRRRPPSPRSPGACSTSAAP